MLDVDQLRDTITPIRIAFAEHALVLPVPVSVLRNSKVTGDENMCIE